jgi:hypothetical protein
MRQICRIVVTNRSSSPAGHHFFHLGSADQFFSNAPYSAAHLGRYPDYPKPGILFRDIFPIFQDARAVEMLFARLQLHIQKTHGDTVHAIVGLEARGFLFGPVLAARLGCAFVPIRKKGARHYCFSCRA